MKQPNTRYVQPRVPDPKYQAEYYYDTTKEIILDAIKREYAGLSQENRELIETTQESPEWYVHMLCRLRVENQDGRQEYQDREFIITIISFDKSTWQLKLGSYTGVDMTEHFHKGFLRPEAALIREQKVPIKCGPGGYDVYNALKIVSGLIDLCKSTALEYAHIIRNDVWVYDQNGVDTDITDLVTFDLKNMTGTVEACIAWLKDKYPEIYFTDPNAPNETDDKKKKK